MLIDSKAIHPTALGGEGWAICAVEGLGTVGLYRADLDPIDANSARAMAPKWDWIPIQPETWNRLPSPGPAFLTDKQVCSRLGISLRTLQRRINSAPTGLPGGPLPSGAGSQRQRRRWPAEGLEEWWQASDPKRLAAQRKIDGNDVRPRRARKRGKQKTPSTFEETANDVLRTVQR